MWGRNFFKTKKPPNLDGFLWEQRDSNPRPSACKADALNQLSYAPLKWSANIDVNSIKQNFFEKTKGLLPLQKYCLR